MENKKLRVIVAHPGRQHSYRVATALKESGLLYKYVTTVYDKEDSFVMKLVKLLISKENSKRAANRRCPGLVDSDVVLFCNILSIIQLLLARLDNKRFIANKFGAYISKRFQVKLAYYAIKNNVDVVISYDTNSTVLFQILKEKAPQILRIMDNAHPNRHYLYKVYNEKLDKCGMFKKTLSACGYILDSANAKTFGEEIKLADYHIVASSFSEEALLYEGVDKSKIFKIPYGVDKNKFVTPKRDYISGKLNVMFLGEINQRKGIYQLLEAAKYINNKNIVFNIIGSGGEYYSELYAPYKEYVRFHGRIPFEDLLEQLSINHIFVFPTMGEGFGLVLLEAMAAGLPVITTPYCAGRDIVDEGSNGFIIDSCDTNDLIKKILWCYENLDKLEIMSNNARETAKKFSWERYNNGIVDAVKLSNII